MVDVLGQAPWPSLQGCRPALRMASHPGIESESLGKGPVTVSCRNSLARSQKETRSSSMEAGHQEGRHEAQCGGSVFSMLGTLGTCEASHSREGFTPFQGWTKTLSDFVVFPQQVAQLGCKSRYSTAETMSTQM